MFIVNPNKSSFNFTLNFSFLFSQAVRPALSITTSSSVPYSVSRFVYIITIKISFPNELVQNEFISDRSFCSGTKYSHMLQVAKASYKCGMS